MYEVFRQYYDSVSPEGFRRDLGQKTYVICLRDADGKLQGFTTIEVIEQVFEGQRIRALYSGDTIIHEDFRGEQTLPWAFTRLAGRIKREARDVPLYWFLIVKGDKTYRYLPAFLHEFYPNCRTATPPWARRLMNSLATAKFGADYEALAGVARFARSHGHLRADCAAPEPGRERRPDVRFFLETNPGYHRGDELVCLAELSATNLRSIGRTDFLDG